MREENWFMKDTKGSRESRRIDKSKISGFRTRTVFDRTDV